LLRRNRTPPQRAPGSHLHNHNDQPPLHTRPPALRQRRHWPHHKRQRNRNRHHPTPHRTKRTHLGTANKRSPQRDGVRGRTESSSRPTVHAADQESPSKGPLPRHAGRGSTDSRLTL